MAAAGADAGGRDEQLYQVLLEYLESEERGTPVDAADVVSRYPHLAAELKDFFDTERRLHDLTAPVRWVSETLVRSARPTRAPMAAPASADTPVAEPVVTIGAFQCVRRLGGGAAGVVYEARTAGEPDRVAVRILEDVRSEADPRMQRVLADLQAAAVLVHQNIVQTYAVGAIDGGVFVSMALMDGGSLDDRLEAFAADPRAAGHLLALLARALHYAHANGVVHGGLRPRSVLFDRAGRPAVADFGLAAFAQRGAAPAALEYGSPEQIGSGSRWRVMAPPSVAADVYGLGAILYLLLAGRPPFTGPTAADFRQRVRSDPPPAPRAIRPTADPDLESVCLRCLEKNPADRYPSAEALADDLGRWLSGQPVQTRFAGADRQRFRPVTAEHYPFLVPPSGSGEIGWLGPFRLLKIVGGGGMGIVFRGEDTQLRRAVAVKVMRAELAVEPAARDRMLREARLAAALEHEHVVTIYHVGEERGVPFLVMQWLRGLSLEQFLRDHGALSVSVVLRLGSQVARGLAAAHSHGMLHRDIKPANLWVEPPLPGLAAGEWDPGLQGRIKVLDFGLARPVADETHLTQSGLAVGTPAYMAPEQAVGGTVDHRSDLYSLGVVLYRMCTGKLPERGLPRREAIHSNLTQPQAVRDADPTVTGPLAELIVRLLAAHPEDRPASATEVADRLQDLADDLLAGSRISAPTGRPLTETVAGPPSSLRKRRRWRMAAAAVVMAALLSATYFIVAGLTRLATGGGEVIVAIEDPDATVTVAERGAVLGDATGNRRLALATGEHELAVTVRDRAGVERTFTKSVVLRRGDTAIVDARRELARVTAPPPIDAMAVAGPASPPAVRSDEVDRRAAARVLALGGNVTVRTSRGEQLVRSATELPAERFELVKVDLARSAASDADLAALEGLQALRRLELRQTSVGDAGLFHLRGLTSLRLLGLSGDSSITGEGLSHLSNLRGLDWLALDSTRVSDAGLHHLASLSNLSYLDLTGTGVTDAGLAHLVPLTSLQDLRIGSNTRVSDAGLRHLQGCRSLRVLDLADTSVGDAGLAQLTGVSGLQSLNLEGTQVTDAGMAYVQSMTALRALKLARTAVGDTGLKHVGSLTNLQMLRLNETRVTDAGLAGLAPLRNLQHLEISNVSGLTDAGLVHLQAMTNLTFLVLSGTRVGDAGLAHLASLPKLAKVELGASAVTDAGLEHLARLRSLAELRLQGTAVGDAGVAQLMNQPLPPLGELDLTGARLSEAGAADLRSMFPRLKLAWWEPNRRAAEAVLAAGGTVHVLPAGVGTEVGVTSAGKLPAVYFRLTRVRLTGVRRKVEELLKLAGDLRDRRFDDLQVVDLTDSGAVDGDLALLGASPTLRRLVLDRTSIRGPGLLNLRSAPALVDLSVGAPTLTPAAFRHIGELKRLKRLSLAHSNVTDGDLDGLRGLTHLRELDLTGTAVTEKGISSVQGALPRCEVLRAPKEKH